MWCFIVCHLPFFLNQDLIMWLYVGLKPVDVEFIRRLSPFTSVLPVIAKSDTLTFHQVMNLKHSILNDLRTAGIKPFLFGKSSNIPQNSLDETLIPTVPFAISSIVSSDAENMDASVLMSPEYVPPLIDTELKSLVDQMFNPDNVAWLKHSAAKKYMIWRANNASSLISTRQLSHPVRPVTPTCSSPTNFLTNSSPHIGGSGSPNGHGAADSFALARVADHTQREERLAKVRLSRWANDLQKSLVAERERYERLAKGERAIWLTERLGECIADGQLIPIKPGGLSPGEALKAERHTAGSETMNVDTRDPLGILQINETVGKKVLVFIKIAGLGGLVGVVGVWICKHWGTSGFQDFIREVRSP
jgi:hypothetical protein